MRVQNSNNLPASLGQVIQAIGESATLALIETYGGTTQRLPAMRNIHEHHFIAQIGEVLLTDLVKHMGASREFYVPKCADGIRKSRDISIVNSYLKGIKVEELARQHYLSDRHIWRILKETNMHEDKQERLF